MSFVRNYKREKEEEEEKKILKISSRITHVTVKKRLLCETTVSPICYDIAADTLHTTTIYLIRVQYLQRRRRRRRPVQPTRHIHVYNVV